MYVCTYVSINQLIDIDNWGGYLIKEVTKNLKSF